MCRAPYNHEHALKMWFLDIERQAAIAEFYRRLSDIEHDKMVKLLKDIQLTSEKEES